MNSATPGFDAQPQQIAQRVRARGDANAALRAFAGMVCLLAILLVSLPILLRCPLWADAITFDCYAQIMQQGGSFYTDAYEVNLPGMAWLHLLVRSLFGWSDLALRSVDFAIIMIISVLATRWIPSARGKIWVVIGILGFYVSSPEIYHCQRDFWMILPMLLALECRLKVNASLAKDQHKSTRFGPATRWTVLEGLMWGAAIWIKPYAFMAIPPVILISIVHHRKSDPRVIPVVKNLAILLLSGLFAGLLGIAGLALTGSLSGFVEVMVAWRPVYDSNSGLAFLISRFGQWQFQYAPWSYLVYIGLVLAISACVRVGRRQETWESLRGPLLGAFFLGWLAQAVTLQHPHVYVLGATLPIAIMLVIHYLAESRPRGRITFGAVVFSSVALFMSPAISPDRVSLWTACLQSGNRDQIRDNLALITHSAGQTSWQELRRVAQFLRSQGIKDGELTCYHISAQPLYLELKVKPSTRFLSVNRMAMNYGSRIHIVMRELAASKQKFIVTDLLHTPNYSLTAEARQTLPKLPDNVPANYRRAFPWRQPVVFRSGRYLVHRVRAR